MPTETRPNLFIVGAQKSGTSALAGWLGQHPEVCMSFPKEPGFLAFGERGYWFRDGYGRPAPAQQYVVDDYTRYLALFENAAPGEHVIGEASTWYLPTPGMADKLREFSPQARIIAIFRNPVERAYSAWCHARTDRVEPCGSFAEALALEQERGEVEHLMRYRRMGLYSDDLAAYQRAFPAAQLLLLFYDDMRADPLAFWRRTCEFLGIDPEVEPPFERRYNRSGDARSPLLQRMIRSYRLKQLLRMVIPHRLGLAAKNRLENFNLKDFPPMDEGVRAELREFFREDITRLQDLTGRNLEAWLR